MTVVKNYMIQASNHRVAIFAAVLTNAVSRLPHELTRVVRRVDGKVRYSYENDKGVAVCGAGWVTPYLATKWALVYMMGGEITTPETELVMQAALAIHGYKTTAEAWAEQNYTSKEIH